MAFTNLLLGTRGTSKATRPHDQIYGLLGLTNERYVDIIPIDYQMNVTQLFTEVAALCLETDGDLDLLYAVQECRNSELPSWVPDWTIIQTRSSKFESGYTSGEGWPSLIVSEDLKMLTLEGYEVDPVIDIDYNSPAS